MFTELSFLPLFLFAALPGTGQEVFVRREPGSNDKIRCPAALMKVLPKISTMLNKVDIEAQKIGLAGWPRAPFGYVDVFENPALDRIWFSEVAMWNISSNRKQFSAILLMREINPPQKNYKSDIEYLDTVYLSDAFGKLKLSRIGVKIHALYRDLPYSKQPMEFPKCISRGFGVGDVWSFEDIHDSGGASTHFVFTPSLGLAFSGFVLETQEEHRLAMRVEAESEGDEMGDSGGHADRCAGEFVENLTFVRESKEYLWLRSKNKLFAFNVAVVSDTHRSILKIKTPPSTTNGALTQRSTRTQPLPSTRP